MANQWLEVDKEGLRELVAKKPAWGVLAELLQNSWDADDTEKVKVTFIKIAGRPLAELIVEDDSPEGFKNLTHAYTLFAPSSKRDNPEKRGVFTLGEKLVLARCKWARISTTKGTVEFEESGKRTHRRKKRDAGTVFHGMLKMNQQQYDEACGALDLFIPPIPTFFNDEELEGREPIHTFEAILPTLRADEEGNLVRTNRKTEVRVYQVKSGEKAHLYEMGIPVVETGDRFHVDICQKVPLNMNRDNVPPSYLRKLRSLVLNETHDLLTADDAAEGWVNEALEDDDVSEEAVKAVVKQRFGSKVVIADPSDREAENRAKARGYTVVHGRSLSKKQWEAVKKADAIVPAGRTFPTKNVQYSADGRPEKLLEKKDWTPAMHQVVNMIVRLSEKLIGFKVAVVIVNDSQHQGNCFSAWYGSGVLHLNLRRLGRKWFEGSKQKILKLLIHELAHEYSSNHLSSDYHDALSKLGAKMTMLALENKRLFR